MRLESPASIALGTHAAFGACGVISADGYRPGSGAEWQGFYVGGNGGFGAATDNLAIVDGTATKCHFCDNTIGGGPTVDHLIAENAGSPILKPRGFSGGLQAGYNRQSANWVYGAEVDFGAFAQRGTNDTSFALPGNTALIGGGGVCGAGGSVHTSASAWRTGWVIGAGFEHALQQNWSAKADYLNMRFAGISAAGHLTDGFGSFADFSNGTGHLSSNLVRVGLNYKFGG